MTEREDRFRVMLDKHKVESWTEDNSSSYQKKWIHLKKALGIAE